MRLDELFKNLGYIAGTIGVQIREACEGVPLAELDLTGAAPREVALSGPGQVVLSEGEAFAIDVQTVDDGEEPRFRLDGERLGIAGGSPDTVVRVTLPAPASAAAGIISAVPMPRNARPMVNFTGLDGCRSPDRSQMIEKTGASAMTKTASTDWNQLDGNSQPKTSLRVSRSAKSVRLEPACS